MWHFIKGYSVLPELNRAGRLARTRVPVQHILQTMRGKNNSRFKWARTIIPGDKITLLWHVVPYYSVDRCKYFER
jgi:hypothetical protein